MELLRNSVLLSSIIILLSAGYNNSLFSATETIPHDFSITTRVDINDPIIRSAIYYWGSYIHSRYIDSIQSDNWIDCESGEKSEDILDSWLPKGIESTQRLKVLILSAEKKTEFVTIRTLWFNTDTNTRLPDPLAITNIDIVMNDTVGDGICNPLSRTTSQWKTRGVRGIKYIVKPEYKINYKAAERMMAFCDSLTALYDVADVDNCTFIITPTGDELAYLCGLEYFASPPKGLAYPNSKTLLSALGNEWYPHEMAHIIFRQFSNTHRFLYEGISVFTGGSIYDSYRRLVSKAFNSIDDKDKGLSLTDIIENPVQQSLLYYALGGIVINKIYETGGSSAVKKFLSKCSIHMPTSSLIQSMENELGMGAGTFNNHWYSLLETYSNKFDD